MLGKFLIRLFSIIFIPLVACQLPGGQSAQPTELPSTIPLPTTQPTEIPLEETPLQFETIEARQPIGGKQEWINRSPGLLVAGTVHEVESVRPYVSDEAFAELEKLDFSQHFALIAFHGWKSGGPQEFQIQEVVYQGNQVSIFAYVKEVQPGEPSTAAESSLYHLIKLPKQGDWERTVTFNLYFDRNQPPVATVEQNIP